MLLSLRRKEYALVAIIILIVSVLATPAHAAGELSSKVYTVDRTAEVIKGITAGTTADIMIANMEGETAALSVCRKDGSACDGVVSTGMTLKFTQGDTTVDSLTVVVTGDATGDGAVSVADYTLVRLHLLKMKTLKDEYLSAGDTNGDGIIAIGDYVRLRLNILRLAELGGGSLLLEGCVIGLDPGHQAHANNELEPNAPGSSVMKKKVSSGTQGRFTRVPEYVVNLQVGLKLKARLEELGATVIMTRTTHDVNISNAERAQMMNEAGVDCWLRIHVNGNNDTTVNGIGVYAPAKGTMNTNDASVQQRSVTLAQALLNPVIAATGAKNNGVPLQTNSTGFNWSSVPVCNVEMGYMSNEREDRLIVTDNYQNKIIDGLVQG
ncbi:MAG: N-acetylmuramoyl-L-alanine amidase, partial [Bacillota bacterium]